jgi:hypothetical protein
MEKDNKINMLADEASGARSLEACGRRRADAEDRIELRRHSTISWLETRQTTEMI